jgi:hypothetical protein
MSDQDSQPPLRQDVMSGYSTDRLPGSGGLEDIRAITHFLERSGVRCCVVDVPALNYYGAKRVVMVRTLPLFIAAKLIPVI